MGFKFQKIFAFLCVALVASDAALSPEEYWNSVLPNSPMPNAVKDLLHPDQVYHKSNNVGVGVNVNVGHNGGGGGESNHESSPFLYQYSHKDTQIKDNPNVALFFIEKDLHLGKKMNLHFSDNSANEATLLQRDVADSIPFSSNKLPEIMTILSVNPNSDKAQVMKKTLEECEAKGIKGEEKFCATSLESMIDFSTSILGNNVMAISTRAEKGDITKLKKYNIVGVKKMPSDKPVVVCHRQEYAYAVFYCHKTETTVAYNVSVVARDGSKAEATAVCHRDTSEWNPKHLAFQVLKVKPGTVPICHFLPKDHIVWVPNY